MILVPKRPVTNISHRLLDFIQPIRERVPSSPAKFVDIREKKEKFDDRKIFSNSYFLCEKCCVSRCILQNRVNFIFFTNINVCLSHFILFLFVAKQSLIWVFFLFCSKMPSTHVQRKLEFPVKKRVTRQSKKKAGKEDVENSPVTHAVSPRKRHGEGIAHFPMWTLLTLQIERVHLSFEGCLVSFFFITVLSAYLAHLRI